MDAYNDVQERVKQLYNIMRAQMYKEFEDCNKYLDNQDYSNAHDCIIRATVYQKR